MTHIPQFNFPAFDQLAAMLRSYGYEVVSPAELDDPVDRAAALASPDGSALSYGQGVKKTWGAFLARDVKLLVDDGIDAVVVLPGWEKSRGARLETFVANALCGLPVYTAEEFDAFSHTVPVKELTLMPVPKLFLVRAWADEPTLSFGHQWHEQHPALTRHGRSGWSTGEPWNQDGTQP
jgi:hypothetical protein